jgi:hypothetical protein
MKCPICVSKGDTSKIFSKDWNPCHKVSYYDENGEWIRGERLYITSYICSNGHALYMKGSDYVNVDDTCSFISEKEYIDLRK